MDHKTPVGEKVTKEQQKGKYSNPLVIFTTIETHDNEKIITKAAKDIRRLARKNESREIIINPFAHLSANLAKPENATKILNLLTEKLSECNEFKTIRSVFGWYKQFLIDVKGHNNSQIYREY